MSKIKIGNKKALLAVLLAGVVVVSSTGCGNKKYESPDFGTIVTASQDYTCYDEYLEGASVEVDNNKESDVEEIKLLEAIETLQEQISIFEMLPNDIKLDESVSADENKEETEIFVVGSNSTYDTLSEIAVRYGTSVEKIVEDNKLTSQDIETGRKLVLNSLTLEKVSLTDAEELMKKYNEEFDNLSPEERIELLNEIVEIREKNSSWIRINAPRILERVAMSSIKCKVCDAYDLTEESYGKVTINDERGTDSGSETDITISDYDVDKKGNARSVDVNLSGDLTKMQNYLYGLQKGTIIKDLTEKNVDYYKEILELAETIVSTEVEVDNNLVFADTIKAKKK